MPGVNRLAADLGINHKTAEAALRQLEREGLLVSQGAGRKRLIVLPGDHAEGRPLRVAILLSEPADRHVAIIVEFQHELVEAGHPAIFPAKSLAELGSEVKRVARLVAETRADAWVVVAGSREMLEWFAANPVPAFALFGQRRDLPMAGDGPDKLPALEAATRVLTDLGHRRIVLIVRSLHRRPQPGLPASLFLATLEACGIRTSDYNLPDWEQSREGFQACLEALFHVTPPTAMIVETPLFAAVQQFLALAWAPGADGRFARQHGSRSELCLVRAVHRAHALGFPPLSPPHRALGGPREPGPRGPEAGQRRGGVCAWRQDRKSVV